MRNTINIAGVVCGVMLVAILLGWWLTSVTNHQSQTDCWQYGQAIEKETKYIQGQGCFGAGDTLFTMPSRRETVVGIRE